MTRRGHGTELLDVWQAGQVDDDGLKRLVEHTVQQVLQAETTAFWRPNHTNGQRPAEAIATG